MELGIRMGDWILRNGEGRGEDLQLCCLLPWSEQPVGSQEMPAWFVSWNKAMCEAGKSEGKDLYNPLVMGVCRDVDGEAIASVGLQCWG